MKRIIFVVLVVAGAALAGESWVGTVSPRAGNANNRAGGTDAGFVLPANAKITVQCGLTGGGSANSYVCIDKTTCSASLGVNLTGNQALPTSTATSRVLTDGGMSALISVYSAQNDDCLVFVRQGNEF
jgi:hypothetical protein